MTDLEKIAHLLNTLRLLDSGQAGRLFLALIAAACLSAVNGATEEEFAGFARTAYQTAAQDVDACGWRGS